MTIAAGFVCQSGVLLCTDSLLSAEQMAYYDKKMVPICGHDYTAIFAFSGDPKFCVSTARQCETVLNRYCGSDRSTQQIVELVTKVWFREFKKGMPRTEYEGYSVVAAIWTRRNGMAELFSSARESFGEVSRGFQCIGAGELTANYVIGNSGFGIGTLESVATSTAIAAVERAKWFSPSTCGGDTVLIKLCDDGTVFAYGKKQIETVEEAYRHFDKSVRDLFLSYSLFSGQTNIRGLFLCALSDFSQEAVQIRDRWQSINDAIAKHLLLPPDSPCRAASAIIFDLHVSRVKLSHLESTKHDPKSPPASQE
jgi:20S proteasome alpha/beta subunit